jgi:hypothetical protein
MKIRAGFVSNSSSSSFCIYLGLMTKQQIEEFSKIVDRDDIDEETHISRVGKYFIGDLGMHDDYTTDYIIKNFKEEDYAMYD